MKPFIFAGILLAALILFSACNKQKSPAPPTSAPIPDAAQLESEAKALAFEEFKRQWTNINGCWYTYAPAKRHVPVMTNVVLRALPSELDEAQRKAGLQWLGEVEFAFEGTRTFQFSSGKWTAWKKGPTPVACALVNTNGNWVVANEFTNLFQMPTLAQLRAALSVR